MRWKPVLYVGLFAALPGCNVASYATHNIVNDPLMECNQVKFRHRLKSQAKAVWEAQARNCPSGVYSKAYSDGFIDGYADQLNDGGPPVPPGAPPVRYRRHANAFTEEGQARERDYLDGFRHGAEVAAATGIRGSTLVELALPATAPEPALNIRCIPASPTVNLRPMPGGSLPVAPDPMPSTPLPIPKFGVEPPPIPKAMPTLTPVRQSSAVIAEDPPRRIAPPTPAPPPERLPPISGVGNKPWVPPRFAKPVPEPGLANFYWAR